jgi:hypothetical protein
VRSRVRARGNPIAVVLVVVAVFGLGLANVPLARGAGYPTVPIGLDRGFVSNLTGAEVAPGGGGTISFAVGNPLAGGPIGSTVLTLQVYAFNAFPGNATSTVDVAAAPVLVTPTTSGPSVNVSLGNLSTGARVVGSVGVQSSATTPSGTFAVRVALRFVAGGQDYLFESRGWFTTDAWAAATQGPNGSVDLNVSALGVSGVVPETSVLVSSSNLSVAIYAVLAAGLVLVGLAAWLYFRPPNSSSGVRKAPEDIHAPSALGNKRTSDGD